MCSSTAEQLLYTQYDAGSNPVTSTMPRLPVEISGHSLLDAPGDSCRTNNYYVKASTCANSSTVRAIVLLTIRRGFESYLAYVNFWDIWLPPAPDDRKVSRTIRRVTEHFDESGTIVERITEEEVEYEV